MYNYNCLTICMKFDTKYCLKHQSEGIAETHMFGHNVQQMLKIWCKNYYYQHRDDI